MQQVRTRDGLPGEAARPLSARVRKVRFKGHGEGLLDVRGEVGNVVLLRIELSNRNLPAFMTSTVEPTNDSD